MNWRVWRWVLAGLGLYLVFLLATFPAGYAIAWLQKNVPEVHLEGVNGSVWAGSAQEVAWQDQFWGSLHWSFDWRALFAGHMGYRFHLEAPDVVLLARVAGNNRKLLLQDVAGHLPISRLAPWLPLPPGSVAGELNIRLDRVLLVKDRPEAAVGTLSVTSLNLSWPQSVTLGNYQLKLQTEVDGIRGDLLDTSGPLMLQGSVQLAPDGHYQVSGTLASRDPGNSALNNLLHYLPSNADGKHPFDFSGTW